jgi:hypothetical protein
MRHEVLAKSFADALLCWRRVEDAGMQLRAFLEASVALHGSSCFKRPSTYKLFTNI